MASRGHAFRITVALVTDDAGEHPGSTAPLTFTHTSHDDIIAVAETVRKSTGLEPDAAAATAVGLKLLGEIMLREKDNTLFDPLRSGIREFIQDLKALAGNKAPG